MSTSTSAISSTVVNHTTIELVERGRGQPILFLHPGIGVDPDAPVLAALARGGRVIAPTHPGFGGSQLPKGMTTVDDMAYFYLDLLDTLDLREALVVGVGFGGWLAAEIATKDASRFSRLVMANPVGVKLGDRETRDMVDIWALMPDEFNALAYFEPKLGEIDYKALPEAASVNTARNREALARFGWSPYMHNPKLKDRLHRIKCPTLFLWGSADRILSEAYGRGYCALIPGATFETIERAGHFPHLEQPGEFAHRVLAFAEACSPRAMRA